MFMTKDQFMLHKAKQICNGIAMAAMCLFGVAAICAILVIL